VENGVHTDDGLYNITWYCAYVKPPFTKRLEYMNKLDELEVHGGITFNGKMDIIGNHHIWGWDYNHYEDMADTDILQDMLQTKLQLKPISEVRDIISKDCREFIRRYLV
jgi:hypothetical protein